MLARFVVACGAPGDEVVMLGRLKPRGVKLRKLNLPITQPLLLHRHTVDRGKNRPHRPDITVEGGNPLVNIDKILDPLGSPVLTVPGPGRDDPVSLINIVVDRAKAGYSVAHSGKIIAPFGILLPKRAFRPGDRQVKPVIDPEVVGAVEQVVDMPA